MVFCGMVWTCSNCIVLKLGSHPKPAQIADGLRELVGGLSPSICLQEVGDEDAVDSHTVERGVRDLDARKIDVVEACVGEVDVIKRHRIHPAFLEARAVEHCIES